MIPERHDPVNSFPVYQPAVLPGSRAQATDFLTSSQNALPSADLIRP
jgi:hypothetical protein